jgi:hypothetical protein
MRQNPNIRVLTDLMCGPVPRNRTHVPETPLFRFKPWLGTYQKINEKVENPQTKTLVQSE